MKPPIFSYTKPLATTLLGTAILMCLSSSAMAANEGNIWYFGANAGLDFNSGAPVPLLDGQINTVEGCASISDTNGDLLFYTDGSTIYDRTHAIMSNGSGLPGNASSSQSGVIIPVIGSSTQYYVFSVDYNTGSNALAYSIVDMTLNNGNGEVTVKNQVITANPRSEKVAIARHSNGQDLWLLTLTQPNIYQAYLITSSGVSTTPVNSAVSTPRTRLDDIGYLRVSPDGTTVSSTFYLEGAIEILDFDPSTGAFTLRESQLGGNATSSYGTEFSADGRFLYVASFNSRTIRQYDLSLPSTLSAGTLLTTSTQPPGALALGPDKKIYIALFDHSNLGIIEFPEQAGASAGIDLTGPTLGGRNSKAGLPTIPSFLVLPPSATIASPVSGTITSDDTPTISGTAGVNNTVSVEIRDSNNNVVETLTPTPDASGNWSVDASSLPDGDYSVTVSATNSEGVVEQAGPNTFTVDTMAPSLTIAQQADGAITSDTTPPFSGDTEQGAAVTVTILDGSGNTVATFAATPDASGAFSADSPQLTDGDYTFTISAEDAAGNVTTSPARSFTIDTVAPGMTLSSPADNALISDDTPTISGQTEAGADVLVVIKALDGTVIETIPATADASGDWSVDASSLMDGPYVVEAIATDEAGNSSTDSHTIVIDTTPPAAAILSPADGASLASSTVTISGQAEPGAAVTVTVSDAAGNVVATLTPALDMAGVWSVDASMLADGDYVVVASAQDPAGNVGTSAPVGFTVDTVAPTLTNSTPSLTQDNTPTISGTTEPDASVTITVLDAGGNVVATLNATADASGHFSVDAPLLSDGTYSLDFDAVDAAGNTADLLEQDALTVDTTPPSLTVTAPADGSVTNDTTPRIEGSAEPGSVVTITITDGAGNVVETISASVDASGNYSEEAASLADGPYTVTVTAEDAATNTTDVVTQVTIDTMAPTITLTAPADGASLSTDMPVYEGTSEPGSTLTITITDEMGNVVDTVSVVAAGDGSWSVPGANALPEGIYQVNIEAVDEAGNTSTLDSSMELDVTAPVTTVTTPADGSVIADTTPSFAGTSEPGSALEVVVTDDMGNIIATLTTTADVMTGMWATDELAAELANGSYTVTVNAEDDAGNTSSAQTTFEVDTNALPIEITSTMPGDSIADDTPTISGTTAPDTKVLVTLTDDAGAVVSTVEVTSDADGNWSVTFEPMLDEGNYVATASVTSPAGVESNDSVGFAIDVTAPELAIAPESLEPTNDTTPTITGTGEPGATVTVTVTSEGGDVVGSYETTVGDDGMWSQDLDELGDGSWQVAAESSDAAGNTSMTDGTLVIDTSLDSTTLDSPVDGSALNTGDPEFSGTAEPGATVTVVVRDESGEEVATLMTVAGDDGAWSVSGTDLEDGDYTVVVSAADEAGNQEELAPITIEVDTTAPELSIDPLDDIGQMPPTVISGTSEPGAKIEVFVDGELVGETTVDDDGTWSIEVAEALEPGEHEVEVIARDEAGNERTETETFTVPDDEMEPEEEMEPIAVDDSNLVLAGGCACNTSESQSTDGSWIGLLLFGLVGLWRRRRHSK